VGKLHHEHLFAGQVLMCRFDNEDDAICLLPFSGEVMLFPSKQLEVTVRSPTAPESELGIRLARLGVDLSAE
jgi:hypothetical protein